MRFLPPYYLPKLYRAGALVALILCGTHPSAAQLQQLWNYTYGGPQLHESANAAAQLSRNRYVMVGQSDTTVAGNMWPIPLLTFTNSQGHLLSQQRLPWLISAFADVVKSRDGGFYALATGRDSSGSLSRSSHPLARFDSVGNLRWLRLLDPVEAHSNGMVLAGLPSGVVTSTAVAGIPQTPTAVRTAIARYGAQGQPRWRRAFGHYTYPKAMAALADGSYVLVCNNPDRVPLPALRRRDFDHLLIKFTATGDSLTSLYIPDSLTLYEQAERVIATSDGGLALVGSFEPDPTSTERRGQFIKLDSLWQEQWRYNLPRFSSPVSPIASSVLLTVQELPGGHFVVLGSGGWNGLVAELTPPLTPIDTASAVWRWLFPSHPNPGYIIPSDWAYQANGQAYVVGVGLAVNSTASDVAVSLINGLSSPVNANLCARPPQTDSLARWNTMPGVAADSLRFTWDSATFRPGPRYAEISQVEWDFGDGTEPAEGWTVTHRFASPNPVRVRVCARNNLGCEVCQELFPLGPLSVRQELEAQVSVYPNPSSDGRFTVRNAANATLTVLDAVGRVVATQGGAAETRLDLSIQPTGVYVLRLAWPNGQALTRRLIR